MVTDDQTATHRALASESRQALLGVLRRRGPIDATTAGEAVGLHRNTARVHLRKLVAAGLVSRLFERRTAPGRPRALYQIVRSTAHDEGRSPSNADYRDLARLLVDQLADDAGAKEKALAAGRRWASALEMKSLPRRALTPRDAIETVTTILDDLGFDPDLSPEASPDCIHLHRCPYADVARENRSVVCSVHLGLIQATLERLDTSIVVSGFEPFVTDDPLLCIVRLADQPAKRKSSVRRKKRLENS